MMAPNSCILSDSGDKRGVNNDCNKSSVAAVCGIAQGYVAAESIKPGEKLLFCAQLTPDMGVIHCQERYA
jgi:hypothetical protein